MVGFEDETWWSRLALPSMHAWGEDGEPLRLVQRSVAKNDPDPKAIYLRDSLQRLHQSIFQEDTFGDAMRLRAEDRLVLAAFAIQCL